MVTPPLMREVLGKSVATYEHLKQSAVRGELRPGRRLAPQDLASYFGISQTPVREALARLAAEGFVGWRMSRGYYSKEYTLAEQTQLHEVGLAMLSASMTRGQGRRPEALLEDLAALDGGAIDAPDGPEQIAQMAEGLYVGLAEAAGNEVMTNFSRIVVERTHLVRLLDMQDRATGELTAMALSAVGRALQVEDLEAAQRICREMVESRLARLSSLVDKANLHAEASRFP